MSLDIKYRPRTYKDVLGQDAAITILREFVQTGRGFHQSYLFCGGHGSGKTTLGRILARALLCEAPVNGEPCDKCFSCLELLQNGNSMDFVEVDAATNSGKADIAKIVQEAAYSTYSGKRRLYLFDEAHQLSKDALDALLKNLEDNIPGSEDKKLTCIFCTTEPEKMRATILSRCAPAFVVQPQKPEHIAARLKTICDAEGIEADLDMLTLIAGVTECHIRDALKAVEGVSMLGTINRSNVTAYLHLDLNTTYIQVLQSLGSDLTQALADTRAILQRVSPVTCYAKLMEVAMAAYQYYLGDQSSSHWDTKALADLSRKGVTLLGYASRLASRPGRPTQAMLLLDLATLHQGYTSVRGQEVVVQVVPSPAPLSDIAPPTNNPKIVAPQPTLEVKPQTPFETPSLGGRVLERDKEWLVDPRLINRGGNQATVEDTKGVYRSPSMNPGEFAILLARALAEKHGGST